ncbi:hypothetical protein APA_3609 [Pseudanabaena sp. lw0831]|nr:hypothetical protein APA_3609 [Pseudanabaena sp. lw0831]
MAQPLYNPKFSGGAIPFWLPCSAISSGIGIFPLRNIS